MRRRVPSTELFIAGVGPPNILWGEMDGVDVRTRMSTATAHEILGKEQGKRKRRYNDNKMQFCFLTAREVRNTLRGARNTMGNMRKTVGGGSRNTVEHGRYTENPAYPSTRASMRLRSALSTLRRKSAVRMEVRIIERRDR